MTANGTSEGRSGASGNRNGFGCMIGGTHWFEAGACGGDPGWPLSNWCCCWHVSGSVVSFVWCELIPNAFYLHFDGI